MILKGSQRGGAKQLGLHLLKTTENEHVEIHDVRGFMADDVIGALREAEAISKGTKCRQFLFSVSLSPPEHENVRVETFETALKAIEDRHGLTGQPRVVVFHEKEGRRHCHAVWSRIDAETMTAKPLSFYKNKLREISKQLYLENGWQMPRGLADAKNRDPRNFSLAEWQQAKRIGQHAGELKGMIQEAWAISDTRQAFAHALEERGLYLARGDRRGHVAVTFEGEVISIPRATGKKAKEIQVRLGKPAHLSSVEETRKRIAEDILPRMNSHLKQARETVRRDTNILDVRRIAMAQDHAAERTKLDSGQKARFDQETVLRAKRLRKGARGLWDRLSGKRAALDKQNQLEALWALQRDCEQRQAVIEAQLSDRRLLQVEIKATRADHAQALRTLHFDAANYRLMKKGLEPRVRAAFERKKSAPEVAPQNPLSRLEYLRQQQAISIEAQLGRSRPLNATVKDRTNLTSEERLQRLRQNKSKPPHGPKFER